MFVRRRGLIAGALLAAGLGFAQRTVAAPPLTTIQDVLYKADGTRFNGVAVVSWKSFESADSSNIAMHSITVRIVDGQFRVQLVPNAGLMPPVYYSVRFSSDGKIQFDETWSVPASDHALRPRDVRVTLAPGAVEDTTQPIQIDDVVGLLADLDARPMRGPGYLPGRAAVISASGAIEAAAGSLTDCLRVDGSTGPCGSGTPGSLNVTFVDQENPAGAVDGANGAFQLTSAPNPATSLTLYRNGMLMKLDQDYTLAGSAITFAPAAIPQPGDTLLASYRVQGDAAGALVKQAEILCSGEGSATGAAAPASLGACSIPAGTLQAGDQVEVQFDYAHSGQASGFTFEVRWGPVTMVSRGADAGETLVTGRGEAGIATDGTQISVQSWGASLPLEAKMASADSTADALLIDFRGSLAAEGADSLRLRHYAVIRYPAVN